MNYFFALVRHRSDKNETYLYICTIIP